MKQIAESHGIEELLETFNTSNKKYIDSEVYLKSTEGSEEIWVSLAATGKMCGLGKNNLTLKSEKVEELQKSLEEKVYEEFETQRTRARVAVDYMEASPDIDRPFLHPHGFSESYNRTITRINIHEEIPRFEDTTLDMSQQITKLKTSIEKGYLLIEQYRDSIEKLFNEEADIAEQINFIEEVYYDG